MEGGALKSRFISELYLRACDNATKYRPVLLCVYLDLC